jgi:hypothetical protein
MGLALKELQEIKFLGCWFSLPHQRGHKEQFKSWGSIVNCHTVVYWQQHK